MSPRTLLIDISIKDVLLCVQSVNSAVNFAAQNGLSKALGLSCASPQFCLDTEESLADGLGKAELTARLPDGLWWVSILLFGTKYSV